LNPKFIPKAILQGPILIKPSKRNSLETPTIHLQVPSKLHPIQLQTNRARFLSLSNLPILTFYYPKSSSLQITPEKSNEKNVKVNHKGSYQKVRER
jgi:hypothetical protein